MFGRRKVKVDIHGSQAAREAHLARCLGPSPKPPLPVIGQTDGVIQSLVNDKMVEKSAARAASMDARARGVPIHQILGEQGAVPIDKIVAAIEKSDTAMLANSLDYNVRLPRKILRDFMVAVHAQTDNKLMISTKSNIDVVRQLLTPYADGREIVEVPFSYSVYAEFEQSIDRILEPDKEKVQIDDSIFAQSFIPDGQEDAEVLDLLIDRAADWGASDIHIEPQKQSYNVFFRINGLRDIAHSGDIEQYNRVCAMVKDRSRIDPMETRVPQDGSFSTLVRGKPFDVRVATVPSDGKEKITMRLLDPVRAQMRLAQLGITEVEQWKRIVEYRNGIVLIVGATGSGKTTTLNATVREMERFQKCIYTAEDPVEYRIPYVTHVQMNEAVGLDFARSIKAFMRGDPDVIILGEIRDTVTAAKAIQAAETGHLVIATIHAESVPMALQRLRGLDVKTEDFEMLLRGVLVQFLVRSLCQKCMGKGCGDCIGQGYSGRTVVSEIARVHTPADVRKMMSTDPADKYWRPLWQDLESKLLNKVTDDKEVYRCFSSELEEMAKHSPRLAEALANERANRGMVSEAAAVAAIASLPASEKLNQRAIHKARAAARRRKPNEPDRLDELSIPAEVAHAEVMARDGEPLFKSGEEQPSKPDEE